MTNLPLQRTHRLEELTNSVSYGFRTLRKQEKFYLRNRDISCQGTEIFPVKEQRYFLLRILELAQLRKRDVSESGNHTLPIREMRRLSTGLSLHSVEVSPLDREEAGDCRYCFVSSMKQT